MKENKSKKITVKVLGKPVKGVSVFSSGNLKNDLERLNAIRKSRSINP